MDAVAIAGSEAQPYRLNTALVLLGFLDLAEGASLEGQESFQAVLASREASWLYRAEAWLGLGCIALQSRKGATAYRLLVAAQYVYAFLGLQYCPIPSARSLARESSACRRSSCKQSRSLRYPKSAARSCANSRSGKAK